MMLLRMVLRLSPGRSLTGRRGVVGRSRRAGAAAEDAGEEAALLVRSPACLIEFGALIIFGLAGIALGVVALVQLKRVTNAPQPVAYSDGSNDVAIPKTHGHVLAILGIVFSVLSLVIAALLYFRVVG